MIGYQVYLRLIGIASLIYGRMRGQETEVKQSGFLPSLGEAGGWTLGLALVVLVGGLIIVWPKIRKK